VIQAATALRQVGVRATRLGATDSLENIVSSPLPDGAQCWVIENSAVYRFDKNSSEAADGLRIVAPIAGGGRWYLMPISPSRISSSSAALGSFTANAVASLRIIMTILRNIPAGSSVLAFGTFSGQPPTVDGGDAFLSYQSSVTPAIQNMTRSLFFEATATRRAFTCAGFIGPFNQDVSWLIVRVSFASLVANPMTFAFPPDHASVTAMTVPPLTKV
jgi:hypothetical protein